MSLTNEDLLAISQLLDEKLDEKLAPIKNSLTDIKENITEIKMTLETEIIPCLQKLNTCMEQEV